MILPSRTRVRGHHVEEVQDLSVLVQDLLDPLTQNDITLFGDVLHVEVVALRAEIATGSLEIPRSAHPDW